MSKKEIFKSTIPVMLGYIPLGFAFGIYGASSGVPAWVLVIACFILDLAMKLPVLKQANEILGLIMGLIQGILSVFVVLAIVMSLTSFLNLDWLLAYIKGSLITKVLYENNFVMWLLF